MVRRQQIENNNSIKGHNFLLDQDEKHKKLLENLNKLIEGLSSSRDKNRKNRIYKQIDEFVKSHYRTLVACMQAGVPYYLVEHLLKSKNADLLKYKYIQKELNEIPKIHVHAHPFGSMINYMLELFKDGRKVLTSSYLHVIPLNNCFLSCISARQTKNVENCCKVVNHFTQIKLLI